MSGEPVSRRTRSAIRTCHVAAIMLVGIALGATAQGNLRLAIFALGLATAAHWTADLVPAGPLRAPVAARSTKPQRQAPMTASQPGQQRLALDSTHSGSVARHTRRPH